jgi:hypothetical protein
MGTGSVAITVGTFPFRFTGEQLGGNTAAVTTPASFNDVSAEMCLQRNDSLGATGAGP